MPLPNPPIPHAFPSFFAARDSISVSLRNDDGQLPADGLVGLRITTVAHDLKTGGSGVAHTDWKKAQTKANP